MRKRYLAGIAIAASSEAFAQPVKDPFAPRSDTGSDAKPDVVPALTAPSGACEYITKETCSKSNTSQLLTSGAYVFASVLVFSIVRMWWNKKGTSTIAVRLLVTLAAAAVAAAVLVALDPARGDDLRCCMSTAVFKGEVFLADSTPGRIAVLGLVPAVVLFFIFTFVEGVARKR